MRTEVWPLDEKLYYEYPIILLDPEESFKIKNHYF